MSRWLLRKKKGDYKLGHPEESDVNITQDGQSTEETGEIALDPVGQCRGKTLLNKDIELILNMPPSELEGYLRLRDLVNLTDVRSATLLHHAAKCCRNDMVMKLLQHGADVNVEDGEGCTPLHWAVEEEGSAEVIRSLISSGADPTLPNNSKLVPLHVACEANNVEAVSILLESCDVNIRGESGLTPLHYCALKDSCASAEVLMKSSNIKLLASDYGIYPQHCAAANASRKVLEMLITKAGACGYGCEQMLACIDKDGNTLLHSAVSARCLKAVELCLEYGNPLDKQNNAGCTPLHLACDQGDVDIVQLMLKETPANILSMRDLDGMTPLHRAALFDHPGIINLLVDEGADLTEVDNRHRTPLLVSALKISQDAMATLIGRGADVHAQDYEDKNLLHLVVQGGGYCEAVIKCIESHQVCQIIPFAHLLNQRDIHGCTPIHYATEGGNIKSVHGLIQLGAVVNVGDRKKQSPLHFAARYGRYNSCSRLLDCPQEREIINATDSIGRTPLHLASMNGHKKVVCLLLSRGAFSSRDVNGQTALHLAAQNGYTETMNFILTTHHHLLDNADNDGDTALLCAAREGQVSSVKLLMSHGAAFTINKNDEDIMDIIFSTRSTDIAMTIVQHDRWAEIVLPDERAQRSPIGRLIRFMPEVYMKVLDRCLTKADVDIRSPSYWYKYDFNYLQPSVEEREKSEAVKVVPHLPALNAMVRNNRVELLHHPVCKKYLEMKWQSYGFYFHMANLAMYLTFLGVFTYFVCSIQGLRSPTAQLNCTYDGPDQQGLKECLSTWQRISVIFVVGAASLGILKEIWQIYTQGIRYFFELVNYSEWLLYVTTILFGIHFILPATPSLWNIGAIAVFTAWYNFMLYLRQFNAVGIYVVMFLQIFKTLIRVFFVFLTLIMAFAMAFFILMSQEEDHAFSTVPLSVVRVFTMMAGEFDYMESFLAPATDGDPNSLQFSALTLLFLIALIVLLPVLLMNLLIGLAVGDIASVQKDAKLRRVAMQVDIHTELERRLPLWILRRVDKQSTTIYPNAFCPTEGGFFARCMRYLLMAAGLREGDVDRFSGDRKCTKKSAEMDRMRARVKKILAEQEKQYELLRLIVQRMEITTEADEQDEGYDSPYKTHIREKRRRSQLTEVARDTLIKASTVSALLDHGEKEQQASKLSHSLPTSEIASTPSARDGHE